MTQVDISRLDNVISSLLQKRGLQEKDFNSFFSWNLNDLPNLTDLNELQDAANRVISAIEKNETIGIYGDYDVDGTTSCALMYHFFKMLNIETKIFQPSRFIDGYGLHSNSIDNALKDNVQLLITVDCGITNHEAVNYANENGPDIIITDHHKDNPDKPLPACLLVNPNKRTEKQNSPLKTLAGVGVAFCLCLQIKKTLEEKGKECPSIYSLLQFVAIGTISDLAHLNNTNLKLTRHGLKQLLTTKYVGLKTFLPTNHTSIRMVPSEHIAFQIGPMINAKGRLDHPQKALELLTTEDPDQANLNYGHLTACNNERKLIQSIVFSKAKEQIEKTFREDNHVISIAYGSDWHEGVIGIVASKLVEEFQVPAIIFTDSNEENIIKASARSAGELNLHQILSSMSELFIKFGGHKMAAGLSMPLSNLSDFKNRIISKLFEIPAIERTNSITHDLELNPEDIQPKLLRDLEYLEPFGKGNERPLFRMKGLLLESFKILKEKHISWQLIHSKNKQKFKGISFNYIGGWNKIHPNNLYKNQERNNETLTCWFTLAINRWNGNEYIQLQINKITQDPF